LDAAAYLSLRGVMMLYISTRGGIDPVTSAEAIKTGIAPDGGLFVPNADVKMTTAEIAGLTGMDYKSRALAVLEKFLTDYTKEELKDCIDSSYTIDKFGSIDITPVVKINGNFHVLELWHGTTCAFKDVALQILPHLLVKAAAKTGETDEIVILVATSGDTGKAALEGFKDVGGTKIIVFFPEEGVSLIQKMQMVTQEGGNTYSIAVKGNFDDAQNGVKAIFTEKETVERIKSQGFSFSSANSINWGRLVPQIVYYFSAYADMVKAGDIKQDENINIVVPTGNFGNILAAWYARRMGLPVHRLICASNVNNVLTDFINTGVYDRRRDFKKTMSPSMDILISSNLERLLFDITGQDVGLVSGWMNDLRQEGMYEIDGESKKIISEFFWGGYAGEKETLETIKCIYEDYGYLVDTHTAVGIDVYDRYVASTGDITRTLIASTASPFKFNESVAKAVIPDEISEGTTEFELLDLLSKKTGKPIPEGLRGLDKKPIRHNAVCEKSDMENEVMKILIQNKKGDDSEIKQNQLQP
jgi:threonine synthase